MNPIEQLEIDLKGTSIAPDLVSFDREEGVLTIRGGHYPYPWWNLLLPGVLALIGACITFFMEKADWTLPLLLVSIILISGFFINRRKDSSIRFHMLESEVSHRKHRVPFHALREENLTWKKGIGHTLQLQTPRFTQELLGFYKDEQEQAETFRRNLWQVVTVPDSIAVAARYGSRVTPVQTWALGACAIFAEVNSMRHDHLGYDSLGVFDALFYSKLRKMLQEGWGVETVEDLLIQADSLIQFGHREDFKRIAYVAAQPLEKQQLYIALLQQADGLAAKGIAGSESELRVMLQQLVAIRYEEPRYAELLSLILSGALDSVSDEDSDALILLGFIHELTNDRNFCAEEINRLTLSRDPEFQANEGRRMAWDYVRAILLYRWGYAVGWLTEEYCWEKILPLAIDMQRNHTSWQDLASSYLQGRVLWGGGEPADHKDFIAAAQKLTTHYRSPWNLVPWELPLHRDW